MTIIQLEYVLVVAESKNFTLAADKAFVTQPTLSMQIQKLEKELGVEIFDRSTHPIKITPIGEKIIAQAKVILKEVKKMSQMISELNISLEGTLKVGIIPTVLPTLLPLFYKNFVTQFPKAKLIIQELKTHEILEKLRDDKIDFGILVTPLGHEDIVEKPLYNEPLVAFVPEEHRLSKKSKISDSDLVLDDLLLLDEEHCFRNNVLSICDFFHTEVNPKLEVDSGSFHALLKLSKDGFGMTVLPSLHAEELTEVDKGFIKEFESPTPVREVSLVYHKSQLRLTFIKEFSKMVKSIIRGKIFIESSNLTMPMPK